MNGILEAGDKVKVHIFTDPEHKREIQREHLDQIYEVYEKNGQLGIDYMKHSTSATRVWYDEDGFMPLESFSKVTVVFEKMEG